MPPDNKYQNKRDEACEEARIYVYHNTRRGVNSMNTTTYYVARQGRSRWTAVGLPEWIAADREALVAKAVDWCQAPERLAKRSEGLRERLRRSPLMDHAGYAREWTGALERVVTA